MSPSQPNLAIPYPGLRPFDEADHLLFFGRNEQVNELLMRLEDSAFVAVVGSSGSGKSSLVRAGLLPLLRDGFLFGTDNWKIAVARPVDEPYQRLARKLTVFHDDVTEAEVLRLLRCSDDGLIQAVDAVCDDSEAHVLVVIDQFEELFGFRRAGDSQQQLQNCALRDEAAAFVAMLLAAARKGGDRLRIMITMRSDFVGDCEVFLGLPQAVSQSQFLVPRLTRSQMEEAITGPSQIRHAGFETFDFEPGLITTLTNDAGDRPDQLPLLQHALMRTWKLSDRKYLTVADYTKAGRIEKALSNDADGAWVPLDDDDKQLARQMFLLLCDVSQEGQMTRRRPRAQEVMDVAQVGCANIERVVRVFQAEDRNFLLPPSPETILPTTLLDISHESLLRQWGALRDWLKAEDKSAKEYIQLADRAQLWKTDDDLLRGSELERALEWKEADPKPTPAWAKRYHPEFAKTIKYVENSRKAKEQKTRRTRKRRSLIVGVALMVIAILSGTTILAFLATLDAKKAEASALWQAAIAHRNKGSALKASYEFLDVAQTFSDETQQHNFKLAAQFAIAGLIRSFPHDGEVVNTRYNNKQYRVLSWDTTGAVKLWDMDPTKAEPLWERVNVDDQANPIAVSGALLEKNAAHVLSWDTTGAVKLWDIKAAKPLKYWKHDYPVTGAIFSPDGTHVLSWDLSGALKLWDVKRDGPPKVWETGTKITGAIFKHDGSRILTWHDNGAVKLWDANAGDSLDVKKAEPLRVWKHDRPVTGAIFTHNGSRILSWSTDGVMKMWPLDRSESIKEWKHTTPVDSAQFTQDDARILTWSKKGRAVQSWDAALKDEGLTPKQRILELQVRSAMQLTKAGELVPLSIDEWRKKMDKYGNIKTKQ